MIIHLKKTFQVLIARKLYNQKDFACCFSDRKEPWPTFCCLGHSDVNSHFKNFNTSNTSFTLCEPHKLKHTLSTLSSKHDSMCHRKTCACRAKIHKWEPRQGIPSFQRVSSDHHGLFGLFHLYQWKIRNLYSSLTMNNGKLIRYFRIYLYAIVTDMANFLIPFGMRERNGLFRTVFHLYWCKIKTFGIFTAQWL